MDQPDGSEKDRIMKTTTALVSTLLAGLIVSCIPAGAQQYVAVQYIDQARTPIETKLAGADLAMPGLGLGSSRVQLGKRFDFAEQNKWLAANQLDLLRKELKAITDKEASQRDAAGKLSFESRQELGKQICDLNEKFEEQVIIREQSAPGIEGLRARQAMLMQRISKSVGLGKLAAKKAQVLKAEVRGAMSAIPETEEELTELASKQISQSLQSVNQKLDKELEASSGKVAGQGSFSIRQYDQSNGLY